MPPRELTFDVSDVVSGGERVQQTAWLFEPPGHAAPTATLICLGGGTYDKHYWHLRVPGFPPYSFGEHLAEAGFAILAVDHLGVGSSSNPTAPRGWGLELLADGDAEVVRQFRSRVGSDAPIIGVGHSMGASVAVVAQATWAPFDAIALLGFSPGPATSTAVVSDDVLAAQVQANLDVVRRLAGAGADAEFLELPRADLRSFFYSPDVPESVVAADEAVASRVPARVAAEAMTTAFIASFAPSIRVPLFLGFGGMADVSTDPLSEASCYPGSDDVTLFVLEGSAHCHNFAANRTNLWDRIGSWAHTAVIDQP